MGTYRKKPSRDHVHRRIRRIYEKGRKEFEFETRHDRETGAREMRAMEGARRSLIAGGKSQLAKFCLDMAGSAQSFDDIVRDYSKPGRGVSVAVEECERIDMIGVDGGAETVEDGGRSPLLGQV
jgi:uncharacterized protein (DUF2147 family)